MELTTGCSRGWIRRLDPAPRIGRRSAKIANNGGSPRRAEARRGVEGAPRRRGLWNSRQVGGRIEAEAGKALNNKQQRAEGGREYPKEPRGGPKEGPRPHHQKADKRGRERLSKKAPDEGYGVGV